MKISELIETLTEIQEKHGDIGVRSGLGHVTGVTLLNSIGNPWVNPTRGASFVAIDSEFPIED